MTWIKTIDVNEAQGKLKNLYEKLNEGMGMVPNLMKAQSLNPDLLEAHLKLNGVIMQSESRLTRAQKEMIAVVVSSSNSCDYWTVHHGEALRIASSNDEIKKQVAEDFTKANISNEEKVMLYYVQKLTKEPYSIKERDIVALRKVGFSDSDILDINQVTSYFNYVNRITDGLGVTLENM